MVQPPPDPAPRSAGWVDRLRRVLDLNGEEPILVLVEGDELAYAWLYQALTERGPVEVARDGAELRSTPEGRVVVFPFVEEDGALLNLARPFLVTRRLRAFGWILPGSLPALKRAAPDFVDWVSHVIVAPPGVPGWLSRGIELAQLNPGPVVVDSVDWAVRALDRHVVIDPTRPLPELEAALAEPGWRVYSPVRDTWSAQRVLWFERVRPGKHPPLLDAGDLAVPGARELPCRPNAARDAAALARELEPGALRLRQGSEVATFGWPPQVGELTETKLLVEAWSAGHPDVARALLALRQDGEKLLKEVEARGLGEVIEDIAAPDWWQVAFRFSIEVGCLALVNPGVMFMSLLPRPLRTVGLGAAVVVGLVAIGWGWVPWTTGVLLAAALLVPVLCWMMWGAHRLELDLTELHIRFGQMPFPDLLLLDVLQPRPNLDTLEAAALRSLRDDDQPWLTSLRDAPVRRPLRDADLTRLHDLRACVTPDPAPALAIWERLVLPGYTRLDWRERIAATWASIAAARLAVGDFEGALDAAQQAPTLPAAARVASFVLAGRNERDAAVAALEAAGLAEAPPSARPSAPRVGTTWL